MSTQRTPPAIGRCFVCKCEMSGDPIVAPDGIAACRICYEAAKTGVLERMWRVGFEAGDDSDNEDSQSFWDNSERGRTAAFLKRM